MKVSLVFLTWNRFDFVKRAVTHNIETAKYPIEEIIWVDNGSTDQTIGWMEGLLKNWKHKKYLFKENTGSAAGYNKAYELAGGDLIARPSSDMCMPDGWLRTMVEYFTAIPNTGIVAMINKSSLHVYQKRFYGKEEVINGKTIQPANALGSILFTREIIDKGIFLPTDGLYGYDDTRWTLAVRDAGYKTYYIPGVVEDFPEEELNKYPEYVKWKSKEIERLLQKNPELKSLDSKING